jgi:hypothetical protein
MLKRGDRVVWLPSLRTDVPEITVGTVTDVSQEHQFGSYPGRLIEVARIRWDKEAYALTYTSDIYEEHYYHLVKICRRT